MGKRAQRRSSQRRRSYWRAWKRGRVFPIPGSEAYASWIDLGFWESVLKVEIDGSTTHIWGIEPDGVGTAITYPRPPQKCATFEEVLLLKGLKKKRWHDFNFQNLGDMAPGGYTIGIVGPETQEQRQNMSNEDEEEGICENCGKEFKGLGQQCEHCGMDGLGPCCIGQLEHPCEDSEEADDGEEEDEDEDDEEDTDEG